MSPHLQHWQLKEYLTYSEKWFVAHVQICNNTQHKKYSVLNLLCFILNHFLWKTLNNNQQIFHSPNILSWAKTSIPVHIFPPVSIQYFSQHQLSFMVCDVKISLAPFSHLSLLPHLLPLQTTSSSHIPLQRNKRTNLILFEFHTLFLLLLQLSHELCEKTFSVLHFFYAFESIILSILHSKLTESWSKREYKLQHY